MAWVTSGIPAGLRTNETLFDSAQMWVQQHNGAIYAWLPAAGTHHWTVRLVATHKGSFHSGALYMGNNSIAPTLLNNGGTITIE